MPRFDPAETLAELEAHGIRLGLERMDKVLDHLGRPQTRFPHWLVAGTNGKGSTSAMLASVLEAHGLRCGLYTSPHLESVEERIRVGGVCVASEELGEALRGVVDAARRAGAEPPTYFEALTLAAFVLFAQHEVDFGVLEVGLGGRLDATNASNPTGAVITSIGLDHTEQLGDTLEAVAKEKAGVARAGRPLLAPADLVAEVAQALEGAARSVAAEWVPVPMEGWTSSGQSLEGQRVAWSAFPEEPAQLDLLGDHQLRNLALACRASQLALPEVGQAWSWEATRRGIAACRWPGRMEAVAVGAHDLLLDGAHNVEAVEVLGDVVESLGRPYQLIFGARQGKPAHQMLARLHGATKLWLTAPEDAKALDPRTLVEAMERTGVVVESVEEAIALALGTSRPRTVVLTGSLYLVGEARGALRRRYGVPPPAAELPTC